MKKIRLVTLVTIFMMFAARPQGVRAETQWSDWSDSEPSGIEKRYETEERTVYQYRDKSHTTSKSSTMAGWTKEKEPTTTWGNWSAWQDAAVSSSATRKVETRVVGTGTYNYLDNPGLPDAPTVAGGRVLYLVNSGTLMNGGDVYWVQKFLFDIRHAFSSSSEVDGWYGRNTANAVRAFQSDYGLSVDGRVGSETANAMMNVWRDATKTEIMKTQYRYQDSTTTYYWYKWSEWSTWSTVKPTTNADREIKSKTQYRYRYTEQSIENVSVIGIDKNYEYTGKAYEPDATLKEENYTLVKDQDYTVEYSDNTNVGIARIVFEGKGTYTNILEYTFEITPKDMTKAEVIMDRNNHTYTGQQITPSIKVILGDETLVSGTDYDIEYSNNIMVGTANVAINGKGNYIGTVNASFAIVSPPQKEETAITQPSTTEAVKQTVNAGTVTLVTMDEQEESGIVTTTGGTDTKVKIKKKQEDKSSNKVVKGTVFESKKASYRVTNVKKKTVVYVSSNTKKMTTIKVPDTIQYKRKRYKVVSIEPNAFKNNKKIKKLIIGKNVKKIGKNAFRGCKNLRSVTFGENVKEIGSYAFYGDKKLFTINFGTRKLKKVGKKAFGNINKHPRALVPEKKLLKYQILIKKAI